MRRWWYYANPSTYAATYIYDNNHFDHIHDYIHANATEAKVPNTRNLLCSYAMYWPS
jgi:hypothetical protein